MRFPLLFRPLTISLLLPLSPHLPHKTKLKRNALPFRCIPLYHSTHRVKHSRISAQQPHIQSHKQIFKKVGHPGRNRLIFSEISHQTNWFWSCQRSRHKSPRIHNHFKPAQTRSDRTSHDSLPSGIHSSRNSTGGYQIHLQANVSSLVTKLHSKLDSVYLTNPKEYVTVLCKKNRKVLSNIILLC